MKRSLLILWLIGILFNNVYGQVAKYYHKYRTSDSHIVLTKWRVNPDDKGDKYIIEIIDNQGRTEELRFIDNDNLLTSDCYNISFIKFQYNNNSITQLNFNKDSTYSAGIECGAPAKIVYYLKDSLIVKCKEFLGYDTYLNGPYNLDINFRKQLLKEKELNHNGKDANYSYIWGYDFASVKYKGCMPVSKNFNSDHIYVPYSVEVKINKFSIYNTRLMSEN